MNSEDPYLRLLQHDDFERKGQRVEIYWVPAHVGFDGNEREDKAAKSLLR